MNAVEIEEAVSELASAPFDTNEFPFAFLQAFGNKETTVRRLRARSGNASDVPGGVLQRSNIHLATCAEGAISETLRLLRESPKTAANKAKFVLATDGVTVEAEQLATGEVVACDFARLGDQFGFFLPLAGISTVRQIKNNPIDVKATGRLNRLYVELLKENPDWGTPERRHDLNQFIARLIFCFFAEDTGIFLGQRLFTETVQQMSDPSAGDTHEVISALFRAMDTRVEDRSSAGVRSWANKFPYVNGSLFSGPTECPRFSRIARSYLLRAGELSWRDINPDIFGSMIQAVAEDGERGALGMHYTSVPNILKVLNPLFLDDLREAVDAAGNSIRKLRALRRRLASIRVFDPACGSGNFLVIAYKEMRAVEAEIDERTGEKGRRSSIPLTNFRGIELRDFPAEIARLALIVSEYQCEVRYRGPQFVLNEFLPLNSQNWIVCGNSLRLDWLSICPPTGIDVALRSADLFSTPSDQVPVEFETEGGETYICGNPPYVWSNHQSKEQKRDLEVVFSEYTKVWKSLDYVAAWFMKAAEYSTYTRSRSAFVATNSICQGQQVSMLWPPIFETGNEIEFAHSGFKWSNLASNNAGVTVVIIGLSRHADRPKRLFSQNDVGQPVVTEAAYINAYLVVGPNIIVEKASRSRSGLPEMRFGNKAVDGGNLILSHAEVDAIGLSEDLRKRLVRRFYGSAEFIKGLQRFCLWLEDKNLRDALAYEDIINRINRVKALRASSNDSGAREMAERPHQFREMYSAQHSLIVVPRVSSEERLYLPVGLLDRDAIVGDRNFALYDAPLWTLSVIASKLHRTWIGTVCGKLETRFLYSNTLGWNTFPVPFLTETNKTDLSRCARDILLARENHFPASMADLYDPDAMPDDLRRAHEVSDDTLERIYIGRRFRNDTERLETLFSMYNEMTTSAVGNRAPRKARAVGKSAAQP